MYFNFSELLADWPGSVVVRERDQHTKGPGSILGRECLSF